MKVFAIIKAAGLAIVFGSGMTVASAVERADTTIGAGIGHPIENHLPSVIPRQFIPIIQGIAGVKEYASQTIAAQIIGAVTTTDQLKGLCHNIDKYSGRLHQQGYDTDYIRDAICDASNKTLATDADIRAQTLSASSKIWVVQALGSTLGNQKALCNIFNVEAGYNVGLDATFVKNEICGAGS